MGRTTSATTAPHSAARHARYRYTSEGADEATERGGKGPARYPREPRLSLIEAAPEARTSSLTQPQLSYPYTHTTPLLPLHQLLTLTTETTAEPRPATTHRYQHSGTTGSHTTHPRSPAPSQQLLDTHYTVTRYVRYAPGHGAMGQRRPVLPLL